MGGREGGVGLGVRAAEVFGWGGRRWDAQLGSPVDQALLDVLLGLDGAQNLDEVGEIVELVWGVVYDGVGRACILGGWQQCCRRAHCPVSAGRDDLVAAGQGREYESRELRRTAGQEPKPLPSIRCRGGQDGIKKSVAVRRAPFIDGP